MKLATLTACLAVTSLLAGHALAGDPVTVTLEQPLAAKTKVVADGAVWVCEKDACVVGRTPEGSLFGVAECKDLARQVGPVASFQLGQRPALQPAALAKCNAGAKAPGQVTAAR
jgi:hypothetical protein